jgi:hypothetical protein
LTIIKDLFGPHLSHFLLSQEEFSGEPVHVKKKVQRKKKGNKKVTHTPIKDEYSAPISSSAPILKLSQNARKKLAKKQTI